MSRHRYTQYVGSKIFAVKPSYERQRSDGETGPVMSKSTNQGSGMEKGLDFGMTECMARIQWLVTC